MASSERFTVGRDNGQSSGTPGSALPAVLAAACAVAGFFLALHYPLAPLACAAAFATAAFLAFHFPLAWLVTVPALLPIIGWAPWTGWITFEEFDILVLAVATGGYARLAARPRSRASRMGAAAADRGAFRLVWLLVCLFALSLLISMSRGFDDAGGFSFGWFQGYREPMNSLRIAKPFFAALLVFPLWAVACRAQPERAASRLSLGLVLGLLGASLAAVWERAAFTGLLDFSSDYRTTALFWEMHVGGAALDGFLALTVPFAVWEMLEARSRRRWALGAVVTGIAAYACLTTFSRGVYIAVPLGVTAMLALRGLQRRRLPQTSTAGADAGRLARLLMISGFGVAAWWMFPTSGYRGLLALAGTAGVLLPLAPCLAHATRAQQIAGGGVGLMLSVLAAYCTGLMPKASYWIFAAAALLAFTTLAVDRYRPGPMTSRHAPPLALAFYIVMLAATGLISEHWGGAAAASAALPVLALLLVAPLLAARGQRSVWPSEPRWLANTFGAMLVAASVVAVFDGGAYMANRFEASRTNLSERVMHWKQGYWLLKSPADFLLGKGLGRFADNYAMSAASDQRPGDYRIRADGGQQYLVMVSGTQVMAYGEMLQMSQRIAPPVGLPVLSLDVRTSEPANLYAWVCLKHLLYNAACLEKQIALRGKPGEWQSVQLQLQGDRLSNGAWYAPRLVSFAMATDTQLRRIDIDNVALTDVDGRDLLRNGAFSDGMAHWFFTSDRNHLPWHIKNMALAVLFDQGWLGLALVTLLIGGALWRVSFGHARAHPLAACLAGALIGFTAVGAFDSLLDVPRVGFVFFLFLLMALTLRSSQNRPFP